MARRNADTDETFEDSMKLTKAMLREPDLYPSGTWEIQNLGFTMTDVEGKDGKPDQRLINLRYKGVAPGNDVDEEAVERGGFEGKTLWARLYLTKSPMVAARDGTLRRVIEFVEAHGVDTDEGDVEEWCKELKERTIMAEVGSREWTDKNTGAARSDNSLKNFSPVGD